jgi:triphosphoribosyl-dephospho-CoA synthase
MNATRPTPGRIAQLACILELMAPKPGNVHRRRDLPDLHLAEFLASALAIAEPLDRAATDGIGEAVEGAIRATRQVVATNTNLGIVLLLAPLAAVPLDEPLAPGVRAVLDATTVADAEAVYRAIRLAKPGGMGAVPEQDVAAEPTLPLKAVMTMAADRDLVARQYANGFEEVLNDALPALRAALGSGHSLETATVAAHLAVLARHPDSLIVRKAGMECAEEVSRRARVVLAAGWPDRPAAVRMCGEFDHWLRDPRRRFNPGTTADLVTAALYAALRDGTIRLPLMLH